MDGWSVTTFSALGGQLPEGYKSFVKRHDESSLEPGIGLGDL